jgi:hypothetical protein
MQPRSIIQQLRAAHGLARVLAVGVSAYRTSSGFHALKACGNDAEAVRDRFRDIEQLNADKANCKACTSKSENPPTRGEILRLLHELADNADSTHRIVFYYSGHGHRLCALGGKEEFYLVPEDAYANDRPDALISFGDVLQILNGSAAKQKIVFLDACGSGPDVAHLKTLPAKLSTKFLTEYLANAVGCAVITSCGTEERSTTQSPNPRLSLFTHYFCEALGGNEDALENGRLTFDSLYSYLSVEVTKRANSYHQKQRPARTQNHQGVLILADFSRPLLEDATLDLGQYPVQRVSFFDFESADVKDVLQNIKRWNNYSQEYLEGKVNSTLPGYLEDRLGRCAAKLTNEVGIPHSEVVIEDAGLRFPDGAYAVTYEANDLRSGTLHHVVSFEKEWFDRPESMLKILKSVGMDPTEMEFELTTERNLESMVAAVKARGWTLKSQKLPKEFTVERDEDSVCATFTPETIHLDGFGPNDILGSETDAEKRALVKGVLLLAGADS